MCEVDREFVQFYHRRVCWLTLRAFDRAVKDADHTLALMDFCLEHSPDDQWLMSQEQYRPFVLFHRIQAAALSKLEHQAPGGGHRGIEPRTGADPRAVRRTRRRGVFRRRRPGRASGGTPRVPAFALSYRPHVGGTFAGSGRQGAVRVGGEAPRRDGAAPRPPPRLLTACPQSITSVVDSGGCGSRPAISYLSISPRRTRSRPVTITRSGATKSTPAIGLRRLAKRHPARKRPPNPETAQEEEIAPSKKKTSRKESHETASALLRRLKLRTQSRQSGG
jgi:hypothetical protein